MTRVVDSSGWIEYLADGPLAAAFAPYLAPPEDVLTPAAVLYEVYRWARREGGDAPAMEAVAQLEQTRLVPADHIVAITAADLSIDHGLAAADALIYATARLEGCELVTADTDFRGLPGVTLIEADD
jgi:Predicted nucleic acid-binding protein, contains PIN domain